MSTHRTYPAGAPTRPIPLALPPRPTGPAHHAGRTWASRLARRARRAVELAPLLAIAPAPFAVGAWAAAEVATAVIGGMP
ncbi:MAG TPA: hypothetical protein VFM55_19085 [Micromonosporaceae bacterium]|nr:hypothetical protein [Micromonosporaceae bacterium]